MFEQLYIPAKELLTTMVLCWYNPVNTEDLLGQQTGVETKALVNFCPDSNQDFVLTMGSIPSKKLSWSSVINIAIFGWFKFEQVKTVEEKKFYWLIS